MNRWDGIGGRPTGDAYAARFAALADAGVDVHGEAAFCATLLPERGSVLDAGCGTGRVAIELARRGFDCVGVDVSDSMLSAARSLAPELEWHQTDLVDLDLQRGFDVVVAAGNVIALLAPGTEAAVIRRLAQHLAPGGSLVAGFGLDAAHLPIPEAPFGLEAYDDWCAEAGLVLERRFATWSGVPFEGSDGGYAVSVHVVL